MLGSSISMESGLTPQHGVVTAWVRTSGEPRKVARSIAAACCWLRVGTTKIQPPKPANGALFGLSSFSHAPVSGFQTSVEPGMTPNPTLSATTELLGSTLIG